MIEPALKIRTYKAYMVANGTGAPTITVYQNNLGFDVNWTRQTTGRIAAVTTGLWGTSRTFVTVTNWAPDVRMIGACLDNNVVRLQGVALTTLTNSDAWGTLCVEINTFDNE